MSYSVCLIDDDIPTTKIPEIEDTKRLNSSNLKALLAKEGDWDDQNIKNLTSVLVQDPDNWNVSAFTNPNIYFNCRKEELYVPEIIILDWEFPTKDVPTSTHLQTILETTFAIVYIFTRTEKKYEVDDLIASAPFNNYEKRIRVIYKEDQDSVRKMLAEIKKIYESSFSFRFSRELRAKALESVDKILVGLGNVILKETSIYFEGKKDLIDFISERFKNYMATTEFEHLEGVASVSRCDKIIIRQLWFYRLFFCKDLKDITLRRGDIIQVGDDKKILYIVIAGDCDLKRFWCKNFGHLSILPIRIMAKENTDLIEKKLCLTRDKNNLKNQLWQKSLTGEMGSFSENAFILPFLKIGNEFYSYIGLPASLTSIDVPKPDGLSSAQLKGESLKYTHLKEYKYLFSISEPFLTPLVQKILNEISGFGVPDFNKGVQEIIKTDSNTLL